MGDVVNDFCLMRSYSALRRDEDGVAGAVSASPPRWWTGVLGTEGPEELDRMGEEGGGRGPNSVEASSARD